MHRLLFIGHGTSPVGQGLQGLLGSQPIDWQQANWDGLTPDALRDCTAHLILADASLQPARALQLFQWLRRHPIATPTFAVLPFEADAELLTAAAQAADDFIVSPFQRDELTSRVERLVSGHDDIEAACSTLMRELSLAQLVGSAPAFTRAVSSLPAIAQSDCPVLLTGETGTGKELCARAIHHLGQRRTFPFIPVECGALPDHLFENEVFGHARGAFTDAHGEQKGLAGMADGGTLFLDEIDALSLAAQAKLLRFLQERTYKPLGADRFVRANVHVIAATNRDLEACIRDKQFRADLYFRLNVLRVHLPPLRARPGDVPLLARHFLASLGEAGGAKRTFSLGALQALSVHTWPGNARELFNVIQRAAVLSGRGRILANHISLPAADGAEPAGGSFREAKAQAIETFENLYVHELLRKHQGNITRAAREAGKERRAFGRLVKKYQPDRRDL